MAVRSGMVGDRVLTALVAGSLVVSIPLEASSAMPTAEVRLGTNPARSDPERDGLDDGAEANEWLTDPTDPDTDGDGLQDGAEAAESGPVSAGDPLRTDVFVEVDYMTGHRPSNASPQLVREAFRSAPVDNPDGTRGISLHIQIDERIPHDTLSPDGDLRTYHRSSSIDPERVTTTPAPCTTRGRTPRGSRSPRAFRLPDRTPTGPLEGRRDDARYHAGSSCTNSATRSGSGPPMSTGSTAARGPPTSTGAS